MNPVGGNSFRQNNKMVYCEMVGKEDPEKYGYPPNLDNIIFYYDGGSEFSQPWQNLEPTAV